jgi:quercetin dioxygenase-like cupin family protein
METIDTTNMCSHLQRKLFDENGEYHRIWTALQDDPELTAVVRSRQLHIYRNGKKILVLAGKSAPKILREDRICEMLKQVETTELFRTSKSWDSAELPDYPKGHPELVAMKYVFPAGKKLGWHHHDVMNHGVLVQGELTIVAQDGTEKVVHEGEAVVEMVGTIHHGENRGTKPAILYMFYLSQQGLPLSVPHPEIPTE